MLSKRFLLCVGGALIGAKGEVAGAGLAVGVNRALADDMWYVEEDDSLEEVVSKTETEKTETEKTETEKTETEKTETEKTETEKTETEKTETEKTETEKTETEKTETEKTETEKTETEKTETEKTETEKTETEKTETEKTETEKTETEKTETEKTETEKTETEKTETEKTETESETGTTTPSPVTTTPKAPTTTLPPPVTSTIPATTTPTTTTTTTTLPTQPKDTTTLPTQPKDTTTPLITTTPVDPTVIPDQLTEDVVIVMDHTHSMMDNDKHIQDAVKEILEKHGSSDARFGVVSFADKPIYNFGWEVSGDYCYYKEIDFTTDPTDIMDYFMDPIMRSGRDFKEAQLEAILSTVFDFDFGSRPTPSAHMNHIYLLTDSNYHEAPQLSEASGFLAPPRGAYGPVPITNANDCKLVEYPDVGLVVDVLADNFVELHVYIFSEDLDVQDSYYFADEVIGGL